MSLTQTRRFLSLFFLLENMQMLMRDINNECVANLSVRQTPIKCGDECKKRKKKSNQMMWPWMSQSTISRWCFQKKFPTLSYSEEALCPSLEVGNIKHRFGRVGFSVHLEAKCLMHCLWLEVFASCRRFSRQLRGLMEASHKAGSDLGSMTFVFPCYEMTM
jgi:hypothetical protein